MILSRNFEKHGSTDINLQFVNRSSFPNLNIGVTFANFLFSGTIRNLIELLKLCNGGDFISLYTDLTAFTYSRSILEFYDYSKES